MKIDVMGVQFDNVTMEQALDRAEILMEAKASAYCVTPNGEIVWEAMHDGAFLDILNGADLVLPDGAGVVMGSRILERPLQEKVAGIAFAEALAQRLAAKGGRLYLLGGKPGIAEKAAEHLTAKYPGLVICGTADGYFQDEPLWWSVCTRPDRMWCLCAWARRSRSGLWRRTSRSLPAA